MERKRGLCKELQGLGRPKLIGVVWSMYKEEYAILACILGPLFLEGELLETGKPWKASKRGSEG